jgi:hypothetical protein
MLSHNISRKTRDVQAEQELAMGCTCEDCEETVDCSPIVTYSFTVPVRAEFAPPVGSPVLLRILENSLRCVVEEHYVEDVPVKTPRGDTLSCRVCLNRFKYVGYISYLLNIPSTDTIYMHHQVIQPVERIRCYTFGDNYDKIRPENLLDPKNPPKAEVSAVSPPEGGYSIATITISLTLTNPCD